MIPKWCFIASAVLVCTNVAPSEWVSLDHRSSQAQPPRVSLLQDDKSSTVLKIEVQGFEVGSLVAGSRTYQTIDLLTNVFTTDVGFPEVPCVAKVLAVPDRAALSLDVIDVGEEYVFQGYTVPPARGSWKEGDSETPYVERQDAYGSDQAYPRQWASVDPPGVFRDFRISRVAVYPVRYVAAKNEIHVASSITLRVKYGAGQVVNPKTTPLRPIPPSFAALYRGTIFNYQSVLDRVYGGEEAGRDVLLCIVPDAFASSLTPFATWRNKTGIYTKVTKFSEIGANSSNPDIIKSYLAQVYHSWTYPPTYVLLAGGYGYVPIKELTYSGEPAPIVSEDYFVEIDGNDYFPEMMIGRFTHGTSVLEQNIVNKVVTYERNPYTANTAWFKKGAVAADMEYPSMAVTKRFARDRMMLDGGFTQVDTFMSHVPCYSTLPALISVINNGISFLNYRGQGWYTGWQPDGSCYTFQTPDVQGLTNGKMLTFVTSIGCGVGAFNQSSCFGEQWLELGTVATPRGAVTFIGPTGNTHTAYNNAIDVGIYTGLFQEGLETPGQALARGRLWMYNTFGGADPKVEYQTRIYCVLGDPSVHVWKDVPRPVRANYPASIPIGYNQVTVAVTDSASGTPVAGAHVCLSGDSVYVTGTTDPSGEVTLQVTSPTVDTLTFLVRGGNVVPLEGAMRIVAAPEYVAPLGSPTIVDNGGNSDGKINPNENIQVSYVLKNWGNQASSNVQATLSVDDTAWTTIRNPGPVSYGTIPPNSSSSPTGTPLEILVKAIAPIGAMLPLRLNVTSSTSSWNYQANLQVVGCDLRYTSVVIDDQGSPRHNGRLDPGETVVMNMTVTNAGQDAAPNASGVLRTTDPYVTLHDSTAGFGTLSIGGSATSSTNYFVVSVDPSCPLRHTASFTVVLSTQNGFYPYSVIRSFTLPVGVPTATDPTGPDGYGYYLYSMDDSLYTEAPAFNWVEIRSVGTRIPWANSGDFTATETLPFTFKYYGRNFSNVRVSSDGWMAFGSGTQTAYTNYPLPCPDNINNMVAVFWDDLFEGSSNSTSKLLYYRDVPNHRFIAEWDSVAHWSGTTLRESFQAILLDPAYYPTPTGDGEIILQYRMVGEEGGCTVGMEDSTETIGTTYLCNGAYDSTATIIHDGMAIRLTTKPPTANPSSIAVAVPLVTGWNLISNPVLRPDSINTVRRLYPHSLTDYAFGYDPGTGYSQTTTMPDGPGYWAKFPAGEVNTITGARILCDSVQVGAGWNIIGSVSDSVDTSAIRTIPPGLRCSLYFGYTGGYSAASQLAPGLGYWVKATDAGQFVLGQSSLLKVSPATRTDQYSGLNSITISDGVGGSQVLYFGSDARKASQVSLSVMPPKPPVGGFDARFESREGGTLLKMFPKETKGAGEFPICVQSSGNPLAVTWQVVDQGSYELVDAKEAQHGAALSLRGTGSGRIAGPVEKLYLRVVGPDGVPEVYALEQNYPNPFNPSTVIKYALPADSRVSLKVYNVLGQEVRSLVNELQAAGYKSIMWDSRTAKGVQASSGVYFVRLRAEGVNGVVFSDVRKMLFMK